MAKEPQNKTPEKGSSILDSYVHPKLPGTPGVADDGRTWRQGPHGSGLQPANGPLAGKLDGIVPESNKESQ